MKKSICLLLTVLVLLVSFGGLTAHAATGTLTASASATNVTIGNTVTITLKYSGGNAKIGSIDAQLSYNAEAFEFVSAGGVTANGGAGVVRMSYFATSTATTTVTATLQFKAIKAGAANFSVTTSEFSNDDDYTSLGTPSKTLAVSAINPTKSANANLASIKPSSGTLTPKFSANVTSYTISVPYTTTSLSLSVTTQDKEAKTAISGKNTLAVGKNTQVITVTAPNGTTKKYTVVINRSANQTTTASGSGTTTTTTTTPIEDPLEVEVGGKTFLVSDTQPSATLPDGFQWATVTINNILVSAAVNDDLNVTLVYLISEQADNSAFYVYDPTDGTFSPFNAFSVKGGSYLLWDLPVGLAAPAGAVAGVYTFGNVEFDVYRFEDSTLADVVLVYATSPAGKTGLFAYDVSDGSMQLYRAVNVPADATPQTTTAAPQSGALVGFIAQYRQVILLGCAALGGLALVIVATILAIVMLRRDKQCKH